MLEEVQSYPLSPPENLRSFWSEAVEEALQEPFDYHRSLSNEFELPGFHVETMTMRGMHGSEIHGWIAFPPGAKRLPSFLWVPPYGRESLLPNAYGTREGFTSLSFNFHGHGAFHQEKYVPERGYFSQGIDDPETWVFRGMAQNALLAARVLQSLPEVDENRIGAMGLSQGGGIAIWLGALSPIIKAVAADLPFLGALHHTITRQAYRYPLKEITDYASNIPLGMERALHTINYFDTMNMASMCHVPTLVSVGLKDPAVRPDQVKSIYEALPGKKELRVYDWGHDWHPDMVECNRTFLLENM